VIGAVSDTWDPGQYERFERERSQPFYDLLALVEPVPGGRVVDLGCGTGQLTAELHRHTGAATTLGIDSSAAMLDRTTVVVESAIGPTFELGDITSFDAVDEYDVVFANASLQWVDDHPALLGRLVRALRSGGQIAVQVPANHDTASHVVAADLAEEMGVVGRRFPVLAPEIYAELLFDLGMVDRHVRLQVYGHELAGPEEVVEWVKGTLLTDYRRKLGDRRYDEFEAEYRRRLLPLLGDRRPYLFAFKRILFHARRP
jgi:trans-aconitate 2-methyltransferase